MIFSYFAQFGGHSTSVYPRIKSQPTKQGLPQHTAATPIFITQLPENAD